MMNTPRPHADPAAERLKQARAETRAALSTLWNDVRMLPQAATEGFHDDVQRNMNALRPETLIRRHPGASAALACAVGAVVVGLTAGKGRAFSAGERSLSGLNFGGPARNYVQRLVREQVLTEERVQRFRSLGFSLATQLAAAALSRILTADHRGTDTSRYDEGRRSGRHFFKSSRRNSV
jgi:hypothetical protein